MKTTFSFCVSTESLLLIIGWQILMVIAEKSEYIYIVALPRYCMSLRGVITQRKRGEPRGNKSRRLSRPAAALENQISMTFITFPPRSVNRRGGEAMRCGLAMGRPMKRGTRGQRAHKYLRYCSSCSEQAGRLSYSKIAPQ